MNDGKSRILKPDRLKIKLFAHARQLAGNSVVEVPWSDGNTVLILKQSLLENYPTLLPLISKLLVAVNNDYVKDDATIRITDEVACFPPVSGG